MSDLIRAVLADKGSTLYTIEPGASVFDAVRSMDAHRIGALLVTMGEEPAGIFTERDVLRRVVAAGRDPAHTIVADVMTREMVVVASRITVADALAIMTERRCRHLPVIDGGRVVGMISAGDLVRWVNRGREVEIERLIEFITGRYPA